MSDNNAQLKHALVSAIKEKQIKILESNKVLLKIIEESIDSKINCSKTNTETLESLDIETLSRIFTNLEVPCYTNTQITLLSKIFELFGEKENNFLCVLLDRAINDFVVHRFAGKPQDFHSRVNPVNNPFSQPAFMQPGFLHPGFNQPGFQQSGFQQPGFQNQPSDFYPNIYGYGPNTNGFQQPFSSAYQKFPNESKNGPVSSNNAHNLKISFTNLLSELRRLYQNAVDQEIGGELLSELNSVVKGFEKLQYEPTLNNFMLIDLRNQLQKVTEKIKNNECSEPWKDLELIDIMIDTILDGYKKP